MLTSTITSLDRPRLAPYGEALPASDDLDREVYAILGIPIDAVGINEVLDAIDDAARRSAPFLISTPNLNFLVASRTNREFKESLLMSDLCPADGMPVVWIARLLGLPIQRVAGSDVFEALKERVSGRRPLGVFFFGGEEGVAAEAASRLESTSRGLVAKGALSPGFGSVEEMSTEDILSKINNSQAEFLLVALGAVKGQEWLRRNHHRLTVPVRTHLGATLNFQARTLQRAPAHVRRLGFEWLWRIKEEPRLWRRYWHDGMSLLGLLLSRVMPLALAGKIRGHSMPRPLRITHRPSGTKMVLKLSGDATVHNAKEAAITFREALNSGRSMVIDLCETNHIDARFFGLLLMVRKILTNQRNSLQFTGVSSILRRKFMLHDVDFLLNPHKKTNQFQ